MKRRLLSLLLIAASSCAINTAKAQIQKVGFFDLDLMVQATPGYPAVDSLVRVFEENSLTAEYDFTLKEFNRLDSTYKADSAAKKLPVILSKLKEQRTQIGLTLVYWQQYSQSKSQDKRQELSAPLYKIVLTAYKKVLAVNNYALVLKPSAIEFLGSTKVDNVFEKVAKELKIPLPGSLKVQR